MEKFQIKTDFEVNEGYDFHWLKKYEAPLLFFALINAMWLAGVLYGFT